ncbi:MAG: hypothetical protein IJ003_03465 [Candidatus Gastranaerophilales bacterium]|nr:hypothetical protein [Candidatus Gastranaerophilales bacterium]
MYVSKISPVVSGNFKIANKAQASTKTVQSNATNSVLMSKDAVNALKSQVAFGAAVQSVQVGIVEDTPTAHVILNGTNKTNTSDIVVNTKEVNGGKKFEAKKGGAVVAKGFISSKLDNKVIVEFNSAKHQPELKVTLEDGQTIQMFQGSSLEAYDGSLKLQMPGDYSNVKGKKVIKDTIPFTGTTVSLLCKKDSTVNATNADKNTPAIKVGNYAQEVRQQDPSFVVLAGGFGTRFGNMTSPEQNKPSFVMPNGASILSAAYDLNRNATGRDTLGQITYLEQTNGKYPKVSEGLLSSDDKVVTMNAYSSDGGAVVRAILDGSIPKDKPLIILNADTITNIDVSEAYHYLNKLDDAGMVIPRYKVSETRAKSFGLMSAGNQVDDCFVLEKFVEKPKNPQVEAAGAMVAGETVNGEQAYYGNPGIYIFGKEVVNKMHEIIEKAGFDPEKPETFSKATGLGKALVPTIVKMCNNGEITRNGKPLRAYMAPMITADKKDAYWDDIGTAEAFVHTAQSIAYETATKDIKDNKFAGIRGLKDFERSVNKKTGVCYASPYARIDFEEAHSGRFKIEGDVYISTHA